MRVQTNISFAARTREMSFASKVVVVVAAVLQVWCMASRVVIMIPTTKMGRVGRECLMMVVDILKRSTNSERSLEDVEQEVGAVKASMWVETREGEFRHGASDVHSGSVEAFGGVISSMTSADGAGLCLDRVAGILLGFGF